MIEAALYDLLNETVDVERRLSRIEVKDYFERTITFDNRFVRNDQTYSFGDGTIDFLIAGSVTKETAAGTGFWRSADRKYTYTRSSEADGSQTLHIAAGSDRFVVRNFTDGKLGITFDVDVVVDIY